jgi:hypothetical protein
MQPSGIPTELPVPQFAWTFTNVSGEALISVVITLVFIWWAIYTLVAIYHWFRYGRESWVAVPAVVLHLAISVWIFVFATGGLH